MEYKKIEFSTNYMNILHSDDDVMIVKMRLMHTGENRNQCDISRDSVLSSIHTFYNKPIIYDLNNKNLPKFSTDVDDHNKSRVDSTMNIAGSIIESGGFELVKEDGREYLQMIGIIHKIYQPLLTKIIKDRNGELKVSIEIKPIKAHKRADGVLVIDEFKLLGVCLLGKNIMEGIEGSNLNVIKYSTEDYNNKFLKFSKEFAMLKMGTKPAIKIDKSKEAMSTSAWGDTDKTLLRNDILEAKNYRTLIKSVYLLVEDGWEDAPSEHLKYPVMEIKGGKVVYNRYALASALAYAEKEDETSVIKKVKDLYKKLELEEKEGESMEMEKAEMSTEEIVENSTEEVLENSTEEVEEVEKIEEEKQEVVEEKEDDEKEEVEEDKEEEIDNSVEEKVDYEMYKQMQEKCEMLEERVKAFERKEEIQKMYELIEEYSHCYSTEEKEEFSKDIESFTFGELEVKINEKVKEFAKAQKKEVEAEKQPQKFSTGFGINIQKQEESKKFSLENYVKSKRK